MRADDIKIKMIGRWVAKYAVAFKNINKPRSRFFSSIMEAVKLSTVAQVEAWLADKNLTFKVSLSSDYNRL